MRTSRNVQFMLCAFGINLFFVFLTLNLKFNCGYDEETKVQISVNDALVVDPSEHFVTLQNLTQEIVQRKVFNEFYEIPIYDFSSPVPDAASGFDCILLTNATPPYQICLHDDDKDIYMSKRLRRLLVWESKLQHLIKLFFDDNPNAMFIDLGMNIGAHTLYAATVKSSVQVLAVEPFPKNILRAHKAAHLNKIHNQIKVVIAAISDKRGTVTFHERKGRVAGNIMIYPGSHTEKLDKGFTTTALLLNDLAPLIKVKKALLKMDIEGQECHAFFNADRLFDQVDIPIILMEILYAKKENSFCFEAMLSVLQSRKYKAYYYPYTRGKKKALNLLDWRDWKGRDVYFEKDK